MSSSRFKRSNARTFFAIPLLGALLVATVLVTSASRTAEAEQAMGLADLQAISNAYAEVVERVSPAVVFIEVTRTQQSPRQRGGGLEDFFNDPRLEQLLPPQLRQQQEAPRERQSQGSGSGFFVSADGLILTNHHVAGGADSVIVRMVDGREYVAEVVGSDEPSDIAVIRVEGSNFPFLELGDSDALRVGEWVLAIGAPFGLASTVTQGIVSAKSRGVGILEYEDFIQTDASINLGNSGGPLIDLNGRVVGVNTAIFSTSRGMPGSVGIGLAIPINSVKLVRDELIASGTVTRGFVGVSMRDLTPDLAEAFGVDRNAGVLVVEVLPGSPAEQAGLRRGDIIVEYDGTGVSTSTAFRTRVAFTKPGETREIVVLRDGRRVQTDLTLVHREAFLAAEEPVATPLDAVGITVQNLSAEMAEQLNFSGFEGVIVTDVTPGSVAQRAGLRRGTLIQEVNNKVVTSVAEFEEAVANHDRSRALLLFVRFQETSNYVTLTLPDE